MKKSYISDEAVAIAEELSLSNVHRDDRETFREFLHVLYTFDKYMPVLQVDIQPQIDHYNVIVRGWNREIDPVKFVNVFASDERDTRCDCVIKTGMIPTPDSGIGPVLNFQLRKVSFNDSVTTSIMKKKRKKKNNRRR